MNFFYKTMVTVSLFGVMCSAHADWWQCNKENVIKTSKTVGASAVFACAGIRSIHSMLNIYGLLSGKIQPKPNKGRISILVNDNIFNAALAAYIAYQTVAYVWPQSVDDAGTDTTEKKSSKS